MGFLKTRVWALCCNEIQPLPLSALPGPVAGIMGCQTPLLPEMKKDGE